MPKIEYLTPDRAVELQAVLLPLFAASCAGNEISRVSLLPEDIFTAIVVGDAAAFLMTSDSGTACVVVFQFQTDGAAVGASVMALAGKDLRLFVGLYWGLILDWLRANNMKYIDACVAPKKAAAIRRLFAFNSTCTLLRKEL